MTESYQRGHREDEAAGSLLVQDGDGCRGDVPQDGLHGVVGAQHQREGLVPLSVLVGQDLHLEHNVVHPCWSRGDRPFHLETLNMRDVIVSAQWCEVTKYIYLTLLALRSISTLMLNILCCPTVDIDIHCFINISL